MNPLIVPAPQVLAQDTAGDRTGDVLRVVLAIVGVSVALLIVVGLFFGAYFMARWLVKQGWILWSMAGSGVLLLVGGYIVSTTPVMLAGGLLIGLTVLILILFALGEM